MITNKLKLPAITYKAEFKRENRWKAINNHENLFSQNLICERNGIVDMGPIELKLSCKLPPEDIEMRLVSEAKEEQFEEFTIDFGKCKGGCADKDGEWTGCLDHNCSCICSSCKTSSKNQAETKRQEGGSGVEVHIVNSTQAYSVSLQQQEQHQQQKQQQQQNQQQTSIQDVKLKLEEKGYNSVSEKDIGDLIKSGKEKCFLLDEIDLFPNVSDVMRTVCLIKWFEAGKEVVGTGFLAKHEGSMFFMTAGHNLHNSPDSDRTLYFNNPGGKYKDEDIKKDKNILKVSLNELKQNNKKWVLSKENSMVDDYFVLELENYCSEYLKELANDAFPLHTSSDKDDKLLLLFGFPAKDLKPGSDIKMKISLGMLKQWDEVKDEHDKSNPKPKVNFQKESELEELVEGFKGKKIIFHTGDTLQGNSGTPVLVRVEDEGMKICGIHLGGTQVHWDGLLSTTKINFARTPITTIFKH